MHAPFPRRTHFVMLALAITVAAVWGSLVPFRLRLLPAGAIWEVFGSRLTDWDAGSRSDVAANLLLYMPFGLFWQAAAGVDRASSANRAAALAVIGATVVLTLALEWAQVLLPARVVSSRDVLAGTAGAATGVLTWLLTGQAVTEWLRRLSHPSPPAAGLDWWLRGWAVGVTVLVLAPLDLTLSARAVLSKLARGEIVLSPVAASGPFIAEALWRAAMRASVYAALFIPVGLWLTVRARNFPAPASADDRPLARSRTVRSRRVALTAGAGFVVALHAGQVLVLSRVTRLADMVAALAGVTIGILLARRIWGPAVLSEDEKARARALHDSLFWWGATAVYALLLTAALTAPLSPTGTPAIWRDRYRSLWRLGAGLDGVGLITAAGTAGLFVVLGLLAARALAPLRPPDRVRVLLMVGIGLAGAAIGGLIEIVQVVLPHRTPEAHDILAGALGAAAGAALGLRRGHH